MSLLESCSAAPSAAYCSLEVAPEQAPHIGINHLPSHLKSILGKQPVSIRQNGRQRAPRVPPLIDHLLENARVRMLRYKRGSQHLEPFPRHLLHNRRIVQKPPAAKWHQVAEFPGVDAKLV